MDDKERGDLLPQAYQTEHATWRMAQRHLTWDDIVYVVSHGIWHRSGGVVHCYLRRKDIPERDRRRGEFSRLEGTVVLLDSATGGTVITVYRNRSRHALKAIRRKQKYDRGRG